MNILYLCEEYPPGKNGGIGTMVQVLARALVKQGHNVFVIGLYPHGYKQADYEEDEGVKVWRRRYTTDIGLIKNTFSFSDNLAWKILKYTTLLHWDTKFSATTLFNFIKNIIEEYTIDIVEMPDWNTMLHNSLTPLTVPAFKIPLVVKLHGSSSYFSTETGIPLNEKIFKAEKKLLQRADAVSSVSRYTADQTKKIFNFDKAMAVLYNSINTIPENSLNREDNKIVFTGALVQRKGVHSLLKAWNIVSRQIPSLKLHLYGKGPVDELKKMIEPDILSSVIFHKHVARELLLRELSTAAVAIFPSYSECFSMAPLEAMSAGCAVIYTERSSGPELINHKKNGLLIDPDNIDAIANALLLLSKDKELRTTIAKSGKELVTDKFNVINAAGEHINFYSEVIKRFKMK